jgi:hypothetical protein
MSTQHPFNWVLGGFSLGVKRQGREADQSHPFSAEAKNGEVISSLPHVCSWRSA